MIQAHVFLYSWARMKVEVMHRFTNIDGSRCQRLMPPLTGWLEKKLDKLVRIKFEKSLFSNSNERFNDSDMAQKFEDQHNIEVL